MPRATTPTIIRTVKNRDNPYVIIHRDVFLDRRLSWKAKGLMGYFLSRPDDWEIRVSDLIQQGPDGRDSVYAGLQELKRAGYVVERIHRHPKGFIVAREYLVYETPQTAALDPENPEEGSWPLDPGFPDQAKPDQAKPDPANPPLLNTDLELNTDPTKQQHGGVTADRAAAASAVVVGDGQSSSPAARLPTAPAADPPADSQAGDVGAPDAAALARRLERWLAPAVAARLVATSPDRVQAALAYWDQLDDRQRARIKHPPGWLYDAIQRGYAPVSPEAQRPRPGRVPTAIVRCPQCAWEAAVMGTPAPTYTCPHCGTAFAYADHHQPWATGSR